MKAIDDFKEDALLLLEAGFIAINQADFESAKRLFKAAEILDADKNMCDIGKGYTALHKLDIPEAKKWFSKVLDRDPHHEMAKTFIAWTQIMDPKQLKEGEKSCEKVMKETKDSDMKQFASSALEFAEHHAKGHGDKKSSPLNLHKKTQKRPH